MQGQRSGGRRVTEESLRTAPLPSGSPNVPAADDSFDGDSHEDSSPEQSTVPITDPNRSRRSRRNNNNGDADAEEHPDGASDDDSSSTESPTHESDRTPEEQKRFDELFDRNKDLEKANAHGSRKITEQGQENAQLRDENAQLKERLGRLEKGFGQLLSQRSPNNGTGGRTSEAGSDYDRFAQDDDPQSEPEDDGFDTRYEIDNLKGIVAGLFQDQRGFVAERAQEQQVSQIKEALGVDAETAAGLIRLKEEGSLLELWEALDLAAYPSEARRIGREQRQRQRDAVSHPSTTGFAENPDAVDTDALRTRAEKLAQMPDSKRKRREVDEFIGSHPEAFDAMAEVLELRI